MTAPTDWDYNKPWYHGSPLHLSILQVDSTITQDRELARVFSHKPTLVSQDVDEQGVRVLKHTGQLPGFLYRVVEEVQPSDVYPHPHSTMEASQEWLITRPLQVELVGPTQVIAHEILTQRELDAMLRGRYPL
jgi:hypothetical protein